MFSNINPVAREYPEMHSYCVMHINITVLIKVFPDNDEITNWWLRMAQELETDGKADSAWPLYAKAFKLWPALENEQ